MRNGMNPGKDPIGGVREPAADPVEAPKLETPPVKRPIENEPAAKWALGDVPS